MAAGTDLELGFHQHSGCIASVGIMTGHAFTTLEGFVVRAGGFTFHHICVTAIAKFWTGSFEQFCIGTGMPFMTGETFASKHRFMGVGLFELDFRIRMA